MSTLYRKRLIPNECICLKNDTILLQNDKYIITNWKTLHPKDEFSKGVSLYVLEKGWKISKFFDSGNELVYIYCDIIDTLYNKDEDTYIFTDLLADVIIENNGLVKVVDLDELSSALDTGIMNQKTISRALTQLNDLLTTIYNNQITHYINILNQYL